MYKYKVLLGNVKFNNNNVIIISVNNISAKKTF